MNEILIPSFPVSEITINKNMDAQTRVKKATANTGISTDTWTQTFELAPFSKSGCSECEKRAWRPYEHFV